MRAILVLLVVALCGCGAVENLGRNCGGDMKEGCRTLFGGEWNEEQDLRTSKLQTESAEIQRTINVLAQNNVVLFELLFEQITSLAALEDSTSANAVSLQSQINNLQTAIHNNTVNIATLQGYHNVTKIIDPCGDTVGKYDEVFLRLSSGKIIASFSDSASGLNTRFAELAAGTYSTTDGTSCTFTVSSSGVVTPSVEY